MKTAIVVLAFFLSLSAKAQTSNAQSCSLTPEVITSNLKLDFQSFDQNLTGGWRAIETSGCELEAAALIEIYHLQNYGSLLDWQNRLLYWHAGQIYGFQEMKSLAKDRFQKSIIPNEPPDDTFKWNAYATGSIAFLEGNLADLKKYRDELASSSAAPKNNLAVLNRMIFCFGKPYKDVYANTNNACAPQ